ncbi:MAG: hypothetical protein Q8M29_02835 [Bacteroidota bacterium]|nr:hypothetical protein [Bacteroidota bacterium]
METAQYQLIEKEAIANMHFPENDVLNSKEEKALRTADLNTAMSLGNLEHSKIRIYFEDDVSPKVVDTTVWGVTDKRVILKQSIMIPIHRIVRIKF